MTLGLTAIEVLRAIRRESFANRIVRNKSNILPACDRWCARLVPMTTNHKSFYFRWWFRAHFNCVNQNKKWMIYLMFQRHATEFTRISAIVISICDNKCCALIENRTHVTKATSASGATQQNVSSFISNVADTAPVAHQPTEWRSLLCAKSTYVARVNAERVRDYSMRSSSYSWRTACCQFCSPSMRCKA